MSARIYTGPVKSSPVAKESIYSNLFHVSPLQPSLVGGFPGSSTAYVDAATGFTLTRESLRKLILETAHGLTTAGSLVKVPTPTQASGFRTLAKGDTIMIYSPNSIAWPVALFAGYAAGIKMTLANSAYTPNELKHQFEDSRASVIFAHPSLLENVFKMFELLGYPSSLSKPRVVVMGTTWLTGVPGEGETAPPGPLETGLVRIEQLVGNGALKHEVKATGHETALMCYSSGTTGKPKGVETSHININSVLKMTSTVFKVVPQDSSIAVLPFYHIYGVVNLLHHPFSEGASIVIMPRFDPVGFCANIEKYKITIACVVPPILIGIVRHPAATKYNMTSLRVLTSGAAPLGGSLVTAVRKRLESVGGKVDVTQGYGLTETSPVTHFLPIEDSLRKVGSIGILLPNLEARLVVADTSEADGSGEDAKPGEPGELWVRGPSIMKGYLNNPSATKDSITPQGWFRTGDIAIVDPEGFYFIVDRKKELIKYKGFQVPPAELESVLLEHPEIADSAVIGINDEKEGTELPRAYIVVANPAAFKSADDKAKLGKDVQEWIKTKVAKHKFLRGGVVVIDIVPKSAAGKILRRNLREQAKAELAATRAKL